MLYKWFALLGGFPPHLRKICSSPPPTKTPPVDSPLPNIYSPSLQISILPQKTNKNITFSYSHWLLYYFCFNFRLFRHTGHANFDFKWCSVFIESFEKCSNCQNHSTSSLYLVKNPPSQQNFWSSPPPPVQGNLPTPLILPLIAI